MSPLLYQLSYTARAAKLTTYGDRVKRGDGTVHGIVPASHFVRSLLQKRSPGRWATVTALVPARRTHMHGDSARRLGLRRVRGRHEEGKRNCKTLAPSEAKAESLHTCHQGSCRGPTKAQHAKACREIEIGRSAIQSPGPHGEASTGSLPPLPRRPPPTNSTSDSRRC